MEIIVIIAVIMLIVSVLCSIGILIWLTYSKKQPTVKSKLIIETNKKEIPDIKVFTKEIINRFSYPASEKFKLYDSATDIKYTTINILTATCEKKYYHASPFNVNSHTRFSKKSKNVQSEVGE